jgi:hypothetical protein
MDLGGTVLFVTWMHSAPPLSVPLIQRNCGTKKYRYFRQENFDAHMPAAPLLSLGLLKVGVPQPWEKSKKNLSYVRQAGVRQFISTYNRVKDLRGDELLWGDEIEYGIFALDDKEKKIRLSLRAKEVSPEESLNRV